MTRPAETLIVRVPFVIRKRGGRKVIDLPIGATPERPRVDNTMLKALARAFRWKRMLESGEFATSGDLAAKERIAPSYMTRVMRMTLLPPAMVEAIVAGRQGPEVTLARLLDGVAMVWMGDERS